MHNSDIFRKIQAELCIDAVQIVLMMAMCKLSEVYTLNGFLAPFRILNIHFRPIVSWDCFPKDIRGHYEYTVVRMYGTSALSVQKTLMEFEDIINVAKIRFYDESTILHRCVRMCYGNLENTQYLYRELPKHLWLSVDKNGQTPFHYWDSDNVARFSMLHMLELIPAQVFTTRSNMGYLAIQKIDSSILSLEDFRLLWIASGRISPVDDNNNLSTSFLEHLCDSTAEDAFEKCSLVMQGIDPHPDYEKLIMRALETACISFQSGDLLRLLLSYVTGHQAWSPVENTTQVTLDNNVGKANLIHLLARTLDFQEFEDLPDDMLTPESIDDRFLALLDKLPDNDPTQGHSIYTAPLEGSEDFSTLEICCMHTSCDFVDTLLTLIPPPPDFSVEDSCKLVWDAYNNILYDQGKAAAMCGVVERNMHNRGLVRAHLESNYADEQGCDRMLKILYPCKAKRAEQ